ncbi:hypothetical protein Lal_00039242 [Lupinus albus]|nr:hypothetical protein Lal_00039242 [Lupinus albus]
MIWIEGVLAGARAAIVASIVTAIPTMASVRVLPWARANLNHTAQALIISTVSCTQLCLTYTWPDHRSLIAVTVASYFVVADKTVLATARKNSFKQPSKSET